MTISTILWDNPLLYQAEAPNLIKQVPASMAASLCRFEPFCRFGQEVVEQFFSRPVSDGMYQLAIRLLGSVT